MGNQILRDFCSKNGLEPEDNRTAGISKKGQPHRKKWGCPCKIYDLITVFRLLSFYFTPNSASWRRVFFLPVKCTA